jgi:hypothetical protein
VAALGAGAAQATPRLQVATQAPLTIRGVGFARHESVRVRLLLPATEMVRRVRATRRGSFSVRFAGATPDRCSGYSLVATGGAGSVARLQVRRRGCPPALVSADELPATARS